MSRTRRFNPNASASGFQPNWGVPAVPINTPLIYRAAAVADRAVSHRFGSARSGIDGGGRQPMGRRERLHLDR